jgi:hypothetical protein
MTVLSASFALTASNITPAITNAADDRILTANGNGTINGESLLQFDGSTLKVLYQSGDEGGEILLNKPVTNTSIAGTGVTIDIYQNKLRFFEQGGTARGAYIDITAASAGVGTNLIATSGGGTVTSVGTSGNVNGITLTGGTITTSGTITLGGTLGNITPSQLATSSIMIGSTSIALGATGSSLTGLTSVTATNFTGTASYASNSNLLDGLDSTAFTLNSQTSSFVQNSQTSSFATFTAFNFYTGSANAFSASILSYTASQNNLNTTFATTGSNTFVGKQNISGSTYVSGTIRQGVLGGTESILEGYGLVVQGSTAKLRVGPNYSTGGDRDYVDIIADGTNSALQTNNENFAIINRNSGGNISLQTSGSGKINITGSLIVSSLSPTYVPYVSSSGILGNTPISYNNDSNITSIYSSTFEDYSLYVVNTNAGGAGGIAGSSAVATGVRGDSDSGVGIGSYTNTGVGVDAYSDGSGIALNVFSGTGTIAQFGSNGGTRMTLTNAGNLGINKSTPSTHLDILGNANITGSLFIAGGNNSISTSIWEKLKLVTAGVTAPARQGSDANGLNFTTNALWNGAWSQDDSTKKSFAYIQHLGNGRHEFRTSPSGGTVSYTTSLTIDESNVNINVPTNITSTTNITGSLNVTGSSRIIGSLGVGIAPSATAGRIDASNDIVAYSTSDIRFKENINPIDNALEKLDQIGGYTFDWKTEEELVSLHGFKGHDIGVIAQEIEAILPEVVTTRDSGYKAVKYEKIVPLLIQAIKEQQLQIKELQDIIKNK